MTPNEHGYGGISDAGSVAEFPLSQEHKGGYLQPSNSITDTQGSQKSLSFPNSIFKRQDEFSLYEQFNKGEK